MQICRYADRCSRLLAIDACLFTKIDFLLKRMSTKIDFAEQQVMTMAAGLVSGSSCGNRDRIDGGSSSRRAEETPAVVAEETSGQQ